MQKEKKTDKRMLPINALRICIDSFEEDISGRLYSRLCGAPIHFENCSGMLLQADALFDRCRYPQSFQEKRSFAKTERSYGYDSSPKDQMPEEEIRKQEGKLATFQVIVRSRSCAGWQGTLLRKDGSVAVRFQSELELLGEVLRELGSGPPVE